MNIRGEAGWDKYQVEADNTIYSVADLVNREVVEPLSDFLDESSTLINLSSNLVQELETISEAVNNWVEENKGKIWYRTIESKRAHIKSVSNTLDIKFKSVHKVIDIEKPKLEARLNPLKTKERQLKTKMNLLATEMNQYKAEVEELNDKPEFKDKTEKLEQIQTRMDKILPEWLEGMISVEQMVQTFPFAVVFLAAFALSTALAAALHYRVLVRELNLKEAGFTDPSFSSLWALTYRGRFGTLLTIGVYTVFTLAMWFFFESGSGILSKLLETRDAWFINKDNFPIIFWLCRMIMVLLISYIFIHPYYIIRKIQSAQAK